MSQVARNQPQVAILRIDQASVIRSAMSALGKGPAGNGMSFAGHGLGSRIAVSPPRNVFWTRVFSFSVWDSEADLGRAENSWAPIEQGSSWSARLEPLRVWQKDHTVIHPDRIVATRHEGPVVSVTISEAIPRNVPAFLRASRPVEEQVLEADGLLWTMGFFKPPMWFSTITIWKSAEAVDAFAYSEAHGGAHRNAIPLVHDWFRRSTTMRFRPYDIKGSLSGADALDDSVLPPQR